jgi:hypothetical protein
MTQSKRPPELPEIRDPHTALRESVRERMRQLARLALLAATPLTNAACDPLGAPLGRTGGTGGLPTPTCEKAPSSWAQFFHAEATWATDAGERIVLLTVSNPADKPWMRAPISYTVEGGTLLPSTPAEPNVLRIKPDAGVTVIRLEGTMSCHVVAERMQITIDAGTAGENPTVVIALG